MTHLLSFTAGGVTCALPLARIRQVISMVELKAPAGERPGEIGTMNLHGRTVPVYSLRRLLALPDRPPRSGDALVIAHGDPDCVALQVDAVKGVRAGTIPTPQVRGPSSSPGAILTEEEVFIYDLPLFIAAGGSVPLPLPPGTAGADEDETPRDPVKESAILAERARAFSEPEEEPRETTSPELLTFQLAGQEYAVRMQYIREVFIIREITPVPGVPDFIAGIGAIRGEIISIVDLRTLFSIPKHGLTDLNRVIVLSNGEVAFGILADYITGIGIRPTDRLAPVEPGMTPIDRRYLMGVADGSVIVLDAAAILADPGMVVDETRK
ncbi:MAG: chemotaxis protein CheW [Methanomicrobiales archaeon]|nr:chemotaxis protein CheW [Methanomicrobiales archaeon]